MGCYYVSGTKLTVLQGLTFLLIKHENQENQESGTAGEKESQYKEWIIKGW